MNVFELREKLVEDYLSYVTSFFSIKNERIKTIIDEAIQGGLLCPNSLIQLNPFFDPGKNIKELIDGKVLHPKCIEIFKKDNSKTGIRLYKHQEEAIKTAEKGNNYILTTGTGSGKSMCYIIPIVDYVLKQGSGGSIKAIIVYPMNALANSQENELQKFLDQNPSQNPPVTFKRYTGQELEKTRSEIIENPPDILLTNYVMLELILTRPKERKLIEAAQGLKFLVFDELHTYRGRQGADVSLLIRRLKNRLNTNDLQCVGTSATISGSGSNENQKNEVAKVAGTIFGAEFESSNIIGESLRRITPENDISNSSFVENLKSELQNKKIDSISKYPDFVNHPLSIWLESNLGVRRDEDSGLLVRATPKSISGKEGLSKSLHELTLIDEKKCVDLIQTGLIVGNENHVNPETGFPPFAFRIHQFIGRGDTVYCTIEDENDRYITVNPQRTDPKDKNKPLYPLTFCRECGQEYYSVWLNTNKDNTNSIVTPRSILNPNADEAGEAGYLYLNSNHPFPTNGMELYERLPDDWVEEFESQTAVIQQRKKDLPRQIRVNSSGEESPDSIECSYIKSPFMFCLECGVSYGARQSDYSKLASLNSGGRSTSTTILSLSAIRHVRKSTSNEKTIPEKLLSFTDNRQDASLQSGHFNDFIEIGLLRSALFNAVKKSGSDGIKHAELNLRVFESLNLPFDSYSQNPEAQYHAKNEIESALREVIGYRLYRDLKRGWRINLPNLEQCGLLKIDYLSLEELCSTKNEWLNCHDALINATPEERSKISRVLLDYIRRELAIKIPHLSNEYQETIRQKSNQRLKEPWAIEEGEKLEYAPICVPRSRRRHEGRYFIHVSSRGGFGRFLSRSSTFSGYDKKLKLDDRSQICIELLEKLNIAGIVAKVQEPVDENDVPGYQIEASSMIWKAGDGKHGFHDLIRIPNPPIDGIKTNQFFVDYYSNIAKECFGIHAHEHTAQVRSEIREMRENDFRNGNLPILYCSPTMELGIDISELNLVNMRNVPPTPANYAQRSGRAGRSGQPALVFTYCTSGSPHDQYYFKRPELMVSGSVRTPRLELANEDLLQSHVQAVWLAETGQSLGSTLKSILDLSGEEPTLDLIDEVKSSISNKNAKKNTIQRVKEIFKSIEQEFDNVDWYQTTWLENVIHNVDHTFNDACKRWRDLYQGALKQAKSQDKIIRNATRSSDEKRIAESLRREAESQLEILGQETELFQSDFYSYRYFASENFLPGYSFPRLPLSAYIPGRRQKYEYLSRPRFLAISEFGPRAFIYHEGSKYQINRVIIPIESDENITTSNVKQCEVCGYIHPSAMEVDVCERCKNILGAPIHQLFRLENVSTRRRERINADEEERMRLGFEIKSGYRFSQRGGVPTFRTALIQYQEETLATLTYDKASTIWRMNLGWKRRADQNQLGFNLDTERGYWEKNNLDPEEIDDPLSRKIQRVVPYVEDRKNSLLFETKTKQDLSVIASLEAALKNAIQVCYQLEDNELTVESLPSKEERNLSLFYESAEGGAGVLKRFVEDADAFPEVAKEALRLCHFNPETGEDLRKAIHSSEECELACYDCLMSYGNQPDHQYLNRHAIKDFLMKCSKAEIHISPNQLTREQQYERLTKYCESKLESDWLTFVYEHKLNLPSNSQELYEKYGTRPDFNYGDHVFIYVDGPIHDFPNRHQRDKELEGKLDDAGITVIRFHHNENWKVVIENYPNIFGKMK